MPHIWNDILVVTQDELVPKFFNYSNLKETVRRHLKKNYGIKRVQRGGNGRIALYNYDTLPAEVQNSIPDPRRINHIMERFYRVDSDAVAYYTTYRFENGTYLRPEYQERYITNASVLQAALRLRKARIDDRRNKGGKTGDVNETVWKDAISFRKYLLDKDNVEHTLPDNYRTFMDTLKAFECEGYETLISKKHGNQNTRKVTDTTLNLLECLFAGTKKKPTATEVHRRYDAFINGYMQAINGDTGEAYDPKDFKALSDTTVKNYMKSWASAIGTYELRSGNRQVYMQHFTPSHSLKIPKYAGSILSIDDRQPPFKMENGKRLWFYMGIDLASEAFTCWVHGETKEGIILEFYRQLVRNYHSWGFKLPAELEAEMSLNSSYKDSFLREGAMFQYVRIEANKARAKKIERYFRSLRYGYEKDKEGWLARPNAITEANQPAIPSENVPRLPYGEIVENSLADITKWNNQPHRTHTHISRWKMFCTMQNPDLKATNYEAILPHIGYKTDTSVRTGTIELNYGEYLLGLDGSIALGEKLIGLMKQVEGKKVVVYWMDDDDGVIFKALVYLDGQLICEAIQKPEYQRARIEQTVDDHHARTIMSAYAATIDAYGRRVKRSIDPIILIDERKPEFDDFVMPGLPKKVRYQEGNTGETGNTETEIPNNNQYMQPGFRRSLNERF
ncbi:hypothetical protein ACFS5N_16460 [Mucilaginibacter ximonensis]|uniref:Mu transposase-like protein n=1 Tax=Mucilaginibacter ximonensis TaxID=538021 RepID=A0ABW5YFH1_9SPHI